VPLFKEVLFQKCSLLPKNISAKIVASYTKPALAASVTSTLPVYSGQISTSNSIGGGGGGGGGGYSVQTIAYNSSYNLETTKLQYDEIKCPYCRRITPNILPYYPYPEVSKVKYVNIPTNLSLKGVTCEYYKHISGGSDETVCSSLCIYNETHDLVLCKKHSNKLDSNSPKQKQNMVKHSITKKRIQDNNNNNNNDENVVISHHNPVTTSCSFALMSGPRKGFPCGKPIWVPKNTESATATATTLLAA
jgi:hypothetical protein